ncbi:alpha/beta fold hydrolase [Arthrobacter sp. SX1312]|uniref:alpha/beta fold hydrolase n=1 Tax=Arthrobacter sp. SX1312 TaxID=2058896 RepID=UPI0011B0336C
MPPPDNRVTPHSGVTRLLAGHSFGGLYVLTFAAKHPADVAGLVVVNSTVVDLGAYVPLQRSRKPSQLPRQTRAPPLGAEMLPDARKTRQPRPLR